MNSQLTMDFFGCCYIFVETNYLTKHPKHVRVEPKFYGIVGLIFGTCASDKPGKSPFDVCVCVCASVMYAYGKHMELSPEEDKQLFVHFSISNANKKYASRLLESRVRRMASACIIYFIAVVYVQCALFISLKIGLTDCDGQFL